LKEVSVITSYGKKGLYLAAILAPPIMIIYLVYHYGVPVPYFSDQWDLVPLIEKMFNHHVTISDLWEHNTEHRAFFPVIILMILAYLTNWNIWYEFYTNVALAGITLLFLYALLKKTFPNHLPPWLAITFSAVVFSTWQHQCWTWGPCISILLCILLVVITVWALDRWPGKLQGVIIALIAAVAASYTYSNGLLTWVIVIPMLVQKKARNWKHISLWAIGFIFTVLFYFHHYTGASQHIPSVWQILSDIPAHIMFILTCLGTPLVYTPGIPLLPLLAGFGLLIAEAFMIFHIARLNREEISNLLSWLVLAAFAFMTACAISLTRLDTGMPMSSRYTSFANLFILSTLVTAGYWSESYQGTRRLHQHHLLLLRRISSVALLTLFIGSSIAGVVLMRSNYHYINGSFTALQKFPETDAIDLIKLCPWGNTFKTYDHAETLANLGIIVPKQNYTDKDRKRYVAFQQLLQINKTLRGKNGEADQYIELGEFYINENDMEKVTASYQKAFSIELSLMQIYLSEIDKYAAIGKTDDAVILLEVLNEVLPGDPVIDLKIACLYSRQDKKEEAIHYLRRAVWAKGLNDLNTIQHEPDLANIRDTSQFKNIERTLSLKRQSKWELTISESIQNIMKLLAQIKSLLF
jgi:tetratricopeptide (TPR) repeat protein